MNVELRIGWLYPDLMSTYGDRGNITILQKRCEWRGIDVTVTPINFFTKNNQVVDIDIFFGGGAQDFQQGILINDLWKKGAVIKNMIDMGTPGLFVCGSLQLFGNYYQNIDGTTWEGLRILDLHTIHFGRKKKRCIGNFIGKISDKFKIDDNRFTNTIVGFENHGGRTYLGNSLTPFATVVKGFGNNGEDGTEGALYNNCIATYSHGPFLTKNPHIADWLIAKALKVKYKKNIQLEKLDDTLEWQAHNYCIHRFL